MYVYIGDKIQKDMKNEAKTDSEYNEEEEKNTEKSLIQIEKSIYPRIEPLIFERWYVDYFDIIAEKNAFDIE
jgi:hypothetical protein